MQARFFPICPSSWDTWTLNPAQWGDFYKKNFVAFAGWTPWADGMAQLLPGFFYQDAYAAYVAQNPNMTLVLKDMSGNPLYIPWGAQPYTQYAADIGNPAWADVWIAGALQTAAKGWKGLYVDDVNMGFDRIVNAAGVQVPVMDPRTGQAMTADAWGTYFDVFLKKIKDVLTLMAPGFKLVHNAIWVETGPAVQTEITLADWIWYERGFADEGVKGGTGYWGVQHYMQSMDNVHAQGTAVALGAYVSSNMPYEFAGYFLMADPSKTDTLYFSDLTPDKWDANILRIFSTDIGNPKGPRQLIPHTRVWKREYDKAIVLLNEDGAGPYSFTPDVPMTDFMTGKPVTSISLGSRTGGIYLY